MDGADAARGWDHPQLTEVLRVGDAVVFAGVGGLLVVDPHDPATFSKPERTSGAPLLDHFGLVHSRTPGSWDAPQRTVLEELFQQPAVQPLRAADLPAGLQNDDALHVLCEIGLPTFAGAEMNLVALGEGGIAERSAEGAWGEGDGSGPYYHLGVWLNVRVVVDGEAGMVYRTPAKDVRSTHPVVAESLTNFVAMLQSYILGGACSPWHRVTSSARTSRTRSTTI